MFQTCLELRLPFLTLASLNDLIEQRAKIFRTKAVKLGNCRELCTGFSIQSIAAAQDLIIRVLARITCQAFMDHFLELSDNRLKIMYRKLLELRFFIAKFVKQNILLHLIAIDYRQ